MRIIECTVEKHLENGGAKLVIVTYPHTVWFSWSPAQAEGTISPRLAARRKNDPIGPPFSTDDASFILLPGFFSRPTSQSLPLCFICRDVFTDLAADRRPSCSRPTTVNIPHQPVVLPSMRSLPHAAHLLESLQGPIPAPPRRLPARPRAPPRPWPVRRSSRPPR